MAAINRGDNTKAFGTDFLRIYLNNPNNYVISKAVLHVNQNFEKVYDNPTFPLKVNFTGEETQLLEQSNTCLLALWDEAGRRRTASGKFTFFVKENKISQADNPQYEEEDLIETAVTFDLTDTEFAAQFVINATPTKMSELIQDIGMLTPQNVIPGDNIDIQQYGDNIKISAHSTIDVNWTNIVDKPSINGVPLEGDITIQTEQINSDWKASSGPAQIINKPNFAMVAYTGNFADLAGAPKQVTKTSQLQNDSGFLKQSDLQNYYNKDEIQEIVVEIQSGTDLVQAIEQVQTNLDEAQDTLNGNISVVDSKVDNIQTELKNQIIENVGSLTNKIELTNQKLSTLNSNIQEKVSQDTLNIQLSSKANTADVNSALELKATKTELENGLNQKLDASDLGTGTLVIKVNGQPFDTFGANAKTNKTVNFEIPTKLSQLQNDTEFVTSNQISLDNIVTKEDLETALSDYVLEEDVGHGQLTFTKNGTTTIATISSNTKNNHVIDFEVPTKLSQLTDDIHVLTENDTTGIIGNINNLQTQVEGFSSQVNQFSEDLENKVTKESGKSLISNTEIARLKDVDNYDDTQIKASVKQNTDNIALLIDDVSNKVDKIDGKDLSTNDFTNEYKEQLETMVNNIQSINALNIEHTNSLTSLNNSLSETNENITTLQNAIKTEKIVRVGQVEDLTSQINALNAKSQVADIVADYDALTNYDKTSLKEKDVICVLEDVEHENRTTYYRLISGDLIYIGAEGKYYTTNIADEKFVPKTLMVNGHVLQDNITITAQDVDALPDTTIIGDGILTIQLVPSSTAGYEDVTQLDTFKANATENTAIRVPIPTKVSHLYNDTNFVTQQYVDDAINVVAQEIDQISTISNQIAMALDNGGSGLANVAFSGRFSDLIGIPTIPVVPTTVSSFTNDAKYISQDKLNTTLENYMLKSEEKLAISQFTNDRGYVTNTAIGRGELTIKIADTTLGTFGANATDNVTLTIPVDAVLDTNSTNPIQTKVVASAINHINEGSVHLSDEQTITGNKTFSGENVFTGDVEFTGNVSLSEATCVTPTLSDNSGKIATTQFVKEQGFALDVDIVHLSGTETITGAKTFTGSISLSQATGITQAPADNSTKLATTEFVKSQGYATNLETVHLSGNETIQGNKTFNDTLTTNGITNLSKYSHVPTPDPTDISSYSTDLVTNVQYVQNELSALHTTVSGEIGDVADRLDQLEQIVNGILDRLNNQNQCQ